MVPGGIVGQSQGRSVSALTVLGVMGEGGAVRHCGRDLHSRLWPLPSVTCIVAVFGLMVPGGCIRSACLQSVPSVDDVGVMGEGGAGRHRGRGNRVHCTWF